MVVPTATLTKDSRWRPCHVAFRLIQSVGVLIANFRSSIPSPPIPLFTLRCAPRDTRASTLGSIRTRLVFAATTIVFI